jgi:hypothetical protein
VVPKEADPLALTTARAFLVGVSEMQRVVFGEGANQLNCVVGRSHVVHALVEVVWLGGVSLYVPACRVGFSGWQLDRLHANSADITCGRAACQAAAKTAHRAAPLTDSAASRRALTKTGVQGQLPLDLSA